MECSLILNVYLKLHLVDKLTLVLQQSELICLNLAVTNHHQMILNM